MSRYREPYTLFKRGKYWYYRTYDSKGIRTTAHSTGCQTKTAAKDFCNNLYLHGSLMKSNVKFLQYAQHFYDDDSPYVKDRSKPLTENTLDGYRNRMKISIIPFFKDMYLDDINYTALKNFRAYLFDKGYKGSVVFGTMSCLKHIIDTAFRDGLIVVNPFNYIEPLSFEQTTRDAFTLNEVVLVANEIGPEFQNIILFMALTGTRISEAVGISLGYNEILTCEKGYEYIKLEKQFNRKKPKDLKMDSRRPIPIIPEVKLLLGFDPLRLSALYRTFQPVKQLIKDFEERQLSFHSLRHFFITNAKSEGCVESKVEFVAGHKLKKIEQTYTNYKVEDLEEIIEWQKETYKKIRSLIDNQQPQATLNEK